MLILTPPPKRAGRYVVVLVKMGLGVQVSPFLGGIRCMSEWEGQVNHLKSAKKAEKNQAKTMVQK